MHAMKPLALAVRDAFLAAADGRLQLANLALTPQSDGARLHVTGFHQDGTPFAVEVPCDGDAVLRAARLASDILNLHRGTNMPAPAAISGLAQTLRDQLKAATARASALSQRAQDSVQNLNGVLDTADGVVADLDKAASEIQAALGLATNGGPSSLSSGPLES
jgi:hypothetical protein